MSGDMRSLSIECQYLLTLTILRRNYDYLEAGYIFKISDDTVSMVFKTWIRFLYKKFGSKEWRDRLFVKFDDLPKPLPDCFLEGGDILNKVRCVIDTTSIKIRRPRNYQKNGNLSRSIDNMWDKLVRISRIQFKNSNLNHLISL